MENNAYDKGQRSLRVKKLIDDMYAKPPETESARAFAAILDGIPIIIREGELIAGSSTLAPRGACIRRRSLRARASGFPRTSTMI